MLLHHRDTEITEEVQDQFVIDHLSFEIGYFGNDQ